MLLQNKNEKNRKKPKSGPRVFSVSHHIFISVAEPAPLVSSAKQHCFTVDAACRHLIRGWKLRA